MSAFIIFVPIAPQFLFIAQWRPSLSWSYGSWINNYLCNQCLSTTQVV